jgi:hypothetical protein
VGGAADLREEAAVAEQSAPRPREWARQRGVRLPSRGYGRRMSEQPRSDDDVDRPDEAGVAGAPETEPEGLGQSAAGD